MVYSDDRHVRIVILNDVYHPDDGTPEAALQRFSTLTGWADAISVEGAELLVCQRFHREAELTRAGVTYRFFADAYPAKPARWFAGTDVMREAVAAFQPSVVHVNGMDYPRAIRRLRSALSQSTAIVVQDHGGFDPAELSVARRLWWRQGLAAADVLLVATEPQAADFRASGVAPDTVRVRDVMEGSTHLQPVRSRRTPNTLNVLCVGRLNENKDPLAVLDGFALFAAKRTDAALTFVYQSAELESQLRESIARHRDVAARVQLAGSLPHDALGAVYGESDIFVAGSHREGSGYAALEAMACGVIPVLTDIAPFRGLTDEGNVGALWEVGNPQALAAALDRVCRSTLLDEQRERCRKRFEDCFSWAAIGRRAMAVYRDCLRR